MKPFSSNDIPRLNNSAGVYSPKLDDVHADSEHANFHCYKHTNNNFN